MTLSTLLTGPGPQWARISAVALASLTFGGAAALAPPAPRAGISHVAMHAGLPPVAALLAITDGAQAVLAKDDDARKANAAIPLLAGALQTSMPFGLVPQMDPLAASRAQNCLALAMYYEAAYEGADGRRAVAQVVLNRVRHPAYPHDVCSVVFQHNASNVCQFTFACDGALRRGRDPLLWRQILAEAEAALHGKVYAPVGMATHYHADYVFPSWATKLDKVAVVGRHLFYRWPDGWGLRGAFSARYSGLEAMPALLPEDGMAEQPATLPGELAPQSMEAPPLQSQNEGGFVDPTKGWVPRVSRRGDAATTSPVALANPQH